MFILLFSFLGDRDTGIPLGGTKQVEQGGINVDGNTQNLQNPSALGPVNSPMNPGDSTQNQLNQGSDIKQTNVINEDNKGILGGLVR